MTWSAAGLNDDSAVRVLKLLSLSVLCVSAAELFELLLMYTRVQGKLMAAKLRDLAKPGGPCLP